MSVLLDLGKLNTTSAAEIASYLRSFLVNHPEAAINEAVHAAVESEATSPLALRLWTTVAQDPVTVVSAVNQTFSTSGRRAGIQRVGKLLYTKQWKTTWDALGGSEGILSRLREYSVTHVTDLCKAVGFCAGRNDQDLEKRERVTELLKSILSSRSQNANADDRPLDLYYGFLLASCTDDFITELYTGPRSSILLHAPTSFLINKRTDLMQRLMLAKLDSNATYNKDIKPVLPLLVQTSASSSQKTERFTPAMQYKLRVMRALDTGECPEFPSEMYATRLLRPLVRCALKRRVDCGQIYEICRLAVTYSEKHYHWQSWKCAIDCLLRCWLIQTELFEELLTKTISLGPENLTVNDTIVYVKEVPLRFRYRIFKLFVRHLKSTGVDLDGDSGFRKLARTAWSYQCFEVLPRDKARTILRKLYMANPEEFQVQRIPGLFDKTSKPDGDKLVDIRLLLTWFESDGADSMSLEAAKELEERRHAANTSRDPIERAFYVQSAFAWAIATGSLPVYRETLKWSRRFLRDHIVIGRVLPQYHEQQPLVDLISGVALYHKLADVDEVTEKVSLGNAVLRDMVDMAFTALRETTFQARVWQAPFRIMSAVVKDRAENELRLRKQLHVSDDELYNILWAGTLELLLTTEVLCLEPGHEKLDARSPFGLLHDSFFGAINLSVSFRFADELARGRNEIWTKFREETHPKLASQPPPWPRGLPIQCLVHPFQVACINAKGKTPFITQRAEEVSMMSSGVAHAPIPSDETARRAVGDFVDSLTVAWKIFVLQQDSKDEPALALWNHCIKHLSQRMTNEEALRFWQPKFRQAFPQFEAPLPPEVPWIDAPCLPYVRNPEERSVWNPYKRIRRNIPERSLSATYLYCSIYRARENLPRSIDQSLSEFGAVVPAWEPELSAHFDFRRAPIKVKEGFIACGLLTLDSQTENLTDVFATPFPSLSDCRYPALALDPATYERQSLYKSPEDAGWTPDRFLLALAHEVPSQVLANMAETAMNSLMHLYALADSDTGTRTTETQKIQARLGNVQLVLVTALTLLREGDRPQIAHPLIARAVLDFPKASAWHRQILTSSILKIISAEDARTFLRSLTDEICSRLATDAPGPKPTQQLGVRPYPKVTTVKLIAQLMSEESFCSLNLQTELLGKIAKQSAHIDIRVSAYASLIQALKLCDEKDSDGIDGIFRVLKTAIPVIGSVNERYVLSEADWVAAEKEGKPPEVGCDDDNSASWPVLQCMLNAVSGRELKMTTRRRLLKDIVVPGISKFKESNARWLRIFLRSWSKEIQDDILDHDVINLNVLHSLLYRSPEITPMSVLQMYHDSITTILRSPPSVKAVTAHVLGQSDLKTSNAGIHWLTLFTERRKKYKNSMDVLVALLSSDLAKQGENGGDAITLETIQSMILTQTRLVLPHERSPQCTTIEGVASDLRPTFSASAINEDRRENWQKTTKPVIVQIVSMLDKLRSEGRNNSDLRFVPSSLSFRLHLLPWPVFSVPKGVDAEKPSYITPAHVIETFTIAATTLLDSIIGTMPLYHRLVRIFQRKLDDTLAVKDKLAVAILLSESGLKMAEKGPAPSQQPHSLRLTNLNGLIRLELAAKLLKEPLHYAREDIPVAHIIVQRWDWDRSNTKYAKEAAKYAESVYGDDGETEMEDEDLDEKALKARQEKATIEGHLRRWTRSPVEEVRNLGWNVLAGLGAGLE